MNSTLLNKLGYCGNKDSMREIQNAQEDTTNIDKDLLLYKGSLGVKIQRKVMTNKIQM